MKLYSIFDMKARLFRVPFPAQNNAEAMRSVATALRSSPESLIAMYPEDFQLFCVGEMDESNCRIVQEEAHMCLCRLDDLVVRSGDAKKECASCPGELPEQK